MGLAGGIRPHPRAIIFDLDRCLIDSRKAWVYCIEESIAAAHGRRVDASRLVDEYHARPWRDALGILAGNTEEARRCEELCRQMFERSAMKKLLVYEGVGMALDSLRSERIELGAISRLPHRLAVKQVQSTGLDRFLAVVAASPADAGWQVSARIGECLTFLEAQPRRCAFVSGETRDLEEATGEGLRPYVAGWSSGADASNSRQALAGPAEVLRVVMRDWARLGAD